MTTTKTKKTTKMKKSTAKQVATRRRNISQFPSDCRLVFRYKGTASTRNDLPECGEVGDLIQVDQWRIDQNKTLFCVRVVWDGEQWINLDPITVDCC